MNQNYICPVCAGVLLPQGRSYICEKHHTFDISKEGYVNLAVGKNGDSGDNKEMCVSRHRFLTAGYYARFAEGICSTISKYTGKVGTVIDAGCGEGYYLRNVKESFPDAACFGIDLAKEAVKLAAKEEKPKENKCSLAVCGIFSLPFADDSADVILSVFAPVGNEENLRVLRQGGIMLVAGPGKEHLSGLKKAVYDSPYENSDKHKEYGGFCYLGCECIKYTATVKKEHIYDLFTMTPYYWKTSKSDAQKLSALESLETELDFVISVYRKI